MYSIPEETVTTEMRTERRHKLLLGMMSQTIHRETQMGDSFPSLMIVDEAPGHIVD